MNSHVAWNLPLVKIIAFCFFGLGAFLCAMNFYLSFLRYPLYWLRGRKAEYRFVSGAPFLGSLLVVVFLIDPAMLQLPRWARFAAFALAALDTGGVHWFIGMMVWQAIKAAPASRRQS